MTLTGASVEAVDSRWDDEDVDAVTGAGSFSIQSKKNASWNHTKTES